MGLVCPRRFFSRKTQSLQVADRRGEPGPRGSWGAPIPGAMRSWADWRTRPLFPQAMCQESVVCYGDLVENEGLGRNCSGVWDHTREGKLVIFVLHFPHRDAQPVTRTHLPLCILGHDTRRTSWPWGPLIPSMLTGLSASEGKQMTLRILWPNGSSRRP